MSGPAFHQVEKLFHEALALTPAQRLEFLETECAGDADLRAAVEDLLRHDNTAAYTDTFLASPVADAAGQLRAETPRVAAPRQGRANLAAPALPAVPGYEILEELGRGGMGVVYKATQTSLNRVVALKMLLPESAAGPELLARFRTEAEVLARQQHPHIIAIYDIGMAQGRPYFSMEYVAGPSLARLLEGRPQDIAGSAHLMETLARTMDTVHKHGIVHRDLKPANILIRPALKARSTESDTALGTQPSALSPQHSLLSNVFPKITDFGLAKDQTTTKKLTQSGMVMGTLCYMAPEQAQGSGREIGPAADLYALGAILYEMLTGRPPFDTLSAAETIGQLLHDEPLSPSRLRPKVPRDLATICLKCLEKAPRRRYASALDLAEDLRRFQAGEPIHARPVSFVERTLRWCRRRPVVTALLFLIGLLALLLVATVWAYDARLENALAQAETKAEDERQLIVRLNVAIGAAEMERGDTFNALLRLAEALRVEDGPPDQERNHRTRIATALRQCPRLLDLRTMERHVIFSQLDPGGGWLAMLGSEAHLLEVRNALTGQAAGPALALTQSVLDGAISRDGRSLVTIDTDGGARLWDLVTGKSEPMPCRGTEAVTRAAFHPNGRTLVTQHADSLIRLWDLTARPLVLSRPLSGATVAVAALSANARWLFTVNSGRVGQLWDVATGSTVGEPVVVEQDVALAAVSPGGSRVALVGSEHTLRVWDIAAAKWAGRPLRSHEVVSHVVFSPDGERVLTFGGSASVQVWEVQKGDLVVLAPSQGAAVREAHFGPEGRLVATTDAAGLGRVWDTATAQGVTPPLRHGGPLAAVLLGADGKEVATVSRSGTVARWLLPDSAESKRDASPEKGPALLKEVAVKEGPQLVKLSDGTRVEVARAVTRARLQPPRLADKVVTAAVFSPDGRHLAVAAADNSARVWDSATGEPVTPPLRQGSAVRDAAFSPDGRRLLTAGEDGTARVWDAVTGEVLTPPLRFSGSSKEAFFDPDGDRAVVVNEAGTVSTWDLTPDMRPVDELIALAQILACGRIDEKQQRQELGPSQLRAAWTRNAARDPR